MANMYIRLPQTIAAFYRGLDEENPLTEWDPYEFAGYTHEATILKNNLRLIPEQNQYKCCLGQRAWNSILRGIKPGSTKAILKRDPQKWPTMEEICTIMGTNINDKLRTMDYLCVKLPDTVILNGHEMRTNKSYSLGRGEADKFSELLRQEFYHVLLEWTEQDMRYCTKMGIHRTRLEMMDRFLTQYNIPVSVDNHERESLRRMYNRWILKAKKRPNDRLRFDSTFLEHISQEELDRAERVRQRINKR